MRSHLKVTLKGAFIKEPGRDIGSLQPLVRHTNYDREVSGAGRNRRRAAPAIGSGQ